MISSTQLTTKLHTSSPDSLANLRDIESHLQTLADCSVAQAHGIEPENVHQL